MFGYLRYLFLSLESKRCKGVLKLSEICHFGVFEDAEIRQV